MTKEMLEKSVKTRKQIADTYYEKHKDEINLRSKLKRDAAISLVKEKRQMIFNVDILLDYLQTTSVTNKQTTIDQNKKNLRNIYRGIGLQDHECLLQYIMKHNPCILINKLQTMKQERNPNEYYGMSIIRKMTEIVLIVSKFIKLNISDVTLFHLFETKCRRFSAILRTMKQDICTETMEKNKTLELPSFQELENKFRDTFGKDSKEYLVLLLYKNCHGRDDFFLYIKHALGECGDKQKNYIIVNNNENCAIALYKYKTSDIYGTHITTMDKESSDIVKQYILTHKLTTMLFPEHEDTKKLSPFLRESLQKVGVKGGVNIMRKVIATSFDNKDASLSMQTKQANSMMHSLGTEIVSYRCVKKQSIEC